MKAEKMEAGSKEEGGGEDETEESGDGQWRW